MSKGFSATGTRSVQNAIAKLRRFQKDIEEIPYEEMQKSAEKIYAEAIAKVPYKTGKLERSIYVRVSQDRRRGGIVAGASAISKNGYDYAGIQHENTSYNHPVKGQAHYISEPFEKEIRNLQRRIRRRLKLK